VFFDGANPHASVNSTMVAPCFTASIPPAFEGFFLVAADVEHDQHRACDPLSSKDWAMHWGRIKQRTLRSEDSAGD